MTQEKIVRLVTTMRDASFADSLSWGCYANMVDIAHNVDSAHVFINRCIDCVRTLEKQGILDVSIRNAAIECYNVVMAIVASTL